MSWPRWPKANPMALAGYALSDIADEIRLATPSAGAPTLDVVRELYDALASRDIRWSLERYHPNDAIQEIRTPASILTGSGDGTCLDLALLFAGAALGKRLIPIVLVLDGHALVAVSLTTERSGADSYGRAGRERNWLAEGLATGTAAADALRALVAEETYVVVECTGFARASSVLDPMTPEGVGRVGDLLTFERACEAGLDQLSFQPRQFRYAVDVAYLQDVASVEVYQPALDGFEMVADDLRARQSLILDDYRVVGGRETELEKLGRFLAGPSGYLLVTGKVGTGKTALLAEWVRQLTGRGDLRTVYYFISRQHDTAALQQDFLQSLVAQGLWAWDRQGTASGTIGVLEGTWLRLLDHERPAPQPTVIVVDGADEALGWRLPRTMFPRRLPANVHVVVSAREVVGRDWRKELGIDQAGVLPLAPIDDSTVTAILDRVEAPGWLYADDAFHVLVDRVRGDPFYLRLICDLVAEGSIANAHDLAHHEVGWDRAVSAWWNDLQTSAAQESVQCLLSYLAVALAPLTRAELVEIDPNDELTGFSFDETLSLVNRWLIGNPSEAGISFQHWRLQEYVAGDDILGFTGRTKANKKLVAWCDRWAEHYLRYTLTKGIKHHLQELADAEPSRRAAYRRQLFDLVRDHDYQQARVEKAGDGPGLVADMNQLLLTLAQAASTDASDLVGLVLEYDDGLERWLRPGTVFKLAQEGHVQDAIDRLALLPARDDWRAAAIACIAWAEVDRDPATSLDLLRQMPFDSPTVRALASRVEAAASAGHLHSEPAPPAEPQLMEQAQAVVKRLSGANMEGIDPASDGSDAGVEGAAYSIDRDARVVIAAASAFPGIGYDLLAQYIDIHVANPYADYRDVSLAGVLRALMTMPDDWKARQFATRTIEGALSRSPVRFGEAVPLNVLARKAASDPQSMYELVERRDHALQAVGTSDMWSLHRRRRATLAETFGRLGDDLTADRLLALAAAPEHGFAGHRAPAYLAIAESNFLTRPGDRAALQNCLDLARNAAHNIQDPAFCGRATAMVNALRDWWAEPVGDVAALIERCMTSSNRLAEFGSRHRIRERFAERSRFDHLPVDQVTNADTLVRLADDVFQIPIVALEAANPDLPRNERLADGTIVVIPDASFMPLVATWMSAQVLSNNLTAEEQVQLLARLVPLALPNPTSLDTLLGRIVATSPEIDFDLMASVEELSRTEEPLGGVEYGSAYP